MIGERMLEISCNPILVKNVCVAKQIESFLQDVRDDVLIVVINVFSFYQVALRCTRILYLYHCVHLRSIHLDHAYSLI